MSYSSHIKTKKEYKEKAVGSDIGKYAFEAGHTEKRIGQVSVEGPHPVHRWYAVVTLDEHGVVRKIS